MLLRHKSDDGFFAVAIKDVELGHVDHEVNALANGGTGTGVEAADHFFAAVFDEGIDFATERFAHGDVGLHDGVFFDATGNVVGVVDVFGADAEVDLLADIGIKLGGMAGRHGQVEGTDVDDEAPIATTDGSFEEVH